MLFMISPMVFMISPMLFMISPMVFMISPMVFKISPSIFSRGLVPFSLYWLVYQPFRSCYNGSALSGFLARTFLSDGGAAILCMLLF